MDNVAFERAINLKKELDELIKVRTIMSSKEHSTAHHFRCHTDYSDHLLDSEKAEIPTRFNDRFMGVVSMLIKEIKDEIAIQIKKANEN